MKISTLVFLMILTFSGCSKEFDCHNVPLQPSFIGFDASDIDTLVIRKFKKAENFQNLVDSFRIIYNPYDYNISNDTTIISPDVDKHKIEAGFDWEIFIPSLNRTIYISEIAVELRTNRCGSGIFASNKSSCSCINPVHSLKINAQIYNFPDPELYGQSIFIMP